MSRLIDLICYLFVRLMPPIDPEARIMQFVLPRYGNWIYRNEARP